MSHDVNVQEAHLELLHEKVTSALIKVLENTSDNSFQIQEDRLTVNCLNVAREVFKILSPKTAFKDLLGGDKDNFEVFGAHPIDDKPLEKQIQTIWQILLDRLEEIPPIQLEKLLKSSTEMGADEKNVFSFYSKKSPFIKNQKGYLQPVSTGENATGTKKMRAHLCRISLTVDSKLLENIKKSILRHHESSCQADYIKDNVEELFDREQEPTFLGLQKLIDEESLGLIKREAEISYLEFLLENAKLRNISCDELAQMLENIRFIEHYINADERSDEDCVYQIDEDCVYQIDEDCVYQITDVHQCDLRDWLETANAFSSLPIIGRIDGNIEEKTSSRGDRTFVFGIRFKANGIVASPEPGFKTLTGNETVYSYHLKKAIEILETAKSYNEGLDIPEEDRSKLNLIGQAIRDVFVYFMVFSKKTNTEKTQEWRELTKKLHVQDIDEILKLASTMLDAKAKVEVNIDKVLDTLKKVLKSESKCQHGDYDRYLLIKKGLLEDENQAMENFIFIDALSQYSTSKHGLKECLRHVCVSQHPDDLALHAIRFNLFFHDIFFHATEENQQQIFMNIQPEKFKFLPIAIVPENFDQALKPKEFEQTLQPITVIFIINQCDLASNKGNDHKQLGAFICRTVIAIVLHLVLAVLCFKLSKYGELAVPILRIHSDNDKSNEEYFNTVCKGVTFLLNEQYRIGLQGLQYINLSKSKESGLKYRIHNARSSLYSFLPKYFTCEQVTPNFSKFAIVILSTRRAETQAATQTTLRQDNWLNLTVRIILFEQVDTHQTKLSSQFRTFAENCTATAPYEGTLQLIDLIRDLYEKQGVKNVLYISKAPFTNNLHLTRSGSGLTLYFASETILKKIREGYPDFNIYPVFFDNYPAKLFSGEKLNALYIDDVSAIQKQVQMDQDKSSRIITFLNIANGMVVGKKEHIFNNVMSYATLDNVYSDVTLNIEVISQQILNDSPTKKTLVYFICLLHAAAFEKVDSSQGKFKLNPYKDIFGDENVNAINTFPIFGQSKKPQFNLFALMTKVQRVIRLLESKTMEK